MKKSTDWKGLWSFLGFVVGLLGGGIALYTMLQVEKPRLRIEIYSNAPVFSLQKDVQDLEIIFKTPNKDIKMRESKQSLSLFTLKFGNFGSETVRPPDFDEKYPFTILIENGTLVREQTKFLESSDKYLVDKFTNEVDKKERELIFPEFFMEPGQFVVIKLLILHNENSKPNIATKGKIANANIEIVESLKEKIEKNSVFSGDLKVQCMRGLFYGVIFCVIILGFFLVFRSVLSKTNKKNSDNELWIEQDE